MTSLTLVLLSETDLFFCLFCQMEEVLSYSLSYGDELWHVVLYQWLIDNALTDRLLEVRSVLSYQPLLS